MAFNGKCVLQTNHTESAFTLSNVSVFNAFEVHNAIQINVLSEKMKVISTHSRRKPKQPTDRQADNRWQ